MQVFFRRRIPESYPEDYWKDFRVEKKAEKNYGGKIVSVCDADWKS